MSSVLYSAGLGVKKQPNKVCATGSTTVKLNYACGDQFFMFSHALVFGTGLAPGPAGSPEG